MESDIGIRVVSPTVSGYYPAFNQYYLYSELHHLKCNRIDACQVSLTAATNGGAGCGSILRPLGLAYTVPEGSTKSGCRAIVDGAVAISERPAYEPLAGIRSWRVWLDIGKDRRIGHYRAEMTVEDGWTREAVTESFDFSVE